MPHNLNKSSGVSLIAGTVLMGFTMVLHPAGGSIEHLIKISSVIIISHSLALLSIPIILYGFWGLTQRLKGEFFVSTMAFIIMSFGLIAVMFAAATNGLVLPLFVKRFDASALTANDTAKLFISYNTTLNHAFDFIYISATCISVLLWSVAILRTNLFSKWIGWLGFVLSTMVVILSISGFVFVNLSGFRVFIMGFICWILSVGFALQRSGIPDTQKS